MFLKENNDEYTEQWNRFINLIKYMKNKCIMLRYLTEKSLYPISKCNLFFSFTENLSKIFLMISNNFATFLVLCFYTHLMHNPPVLFLLVGFSFLFLSLFPQTTIRRIMIEENEHQQQKLCSFNASFRVIHLNEQIIMINYI